MAHCKRKIPPETIMQMTMENKTCRERKTTYIDDWLIGRDSFSMDDYWGERATRPGCIICQYWEED
jgi:hypothetical protein